MHKTLSLETYGLTHFSFDALMKVGKFLQLVSTFLGGFIIAFARGWLLSLVMLSTIPLVVASAGIMSLVLSKLSNRSQMAYAEAGKVIEHTIGSIRTVISLFWKLLPIYFLSLANFFSFMETGGFFHWGEESN
jgi:ABC-type multidrug transport system fused ATPase/permease subunit